MKNFNEEKVECEECKKHEKFVKSLNLTIYEVARRNMVAFANFFIVHNSMTKKEWFDIQKKVLKEFDEELGT